MPDEPLFSVRRIVHAVRWWLWFYVALDHDREPANIPLLYLVRTFHRPYANRDRY